MLIDEIAYTWFNRLAALRFMEVNGYLTTRVLSSSDPKLVDPDMLRDAGYIAEAGEFPGLNLEKLDEWRDLASRSPNSEEWLYRRLLVAQCEALADGLPFLFDRTKNYTALFVPTNLLNQDSIVRRLVTDIPEDDWRDSSDSENGVEIIGWLYPFYISERKDEVIGAIVRWRRRIFWQRRNWLRPTGLCATWWKTPSLGYGWRVTRSQGCDRRCPIIALRKRVRTKD